MYKKYIFFLLSICCMPLMKGLQSIDSRVTTLEEKGALTDQEKQELKILYDTQMQHIEAATMRGIFFDPQRATEGKKRIAEIQAKRDAL